MRRIGLGVTVSAGAVAGLSAQATTGAGATSPVLDAIVAKHYPQQLVDLTRRFSDEDVFRRQCYAVYDTLPSGAPRTIIAAYTNTSTAAIHVLQEDGSGGYRVIANEPPGLDLFGEECEVKIVDVDNDGRAEAVLTFSEMVNDVSWVMKWDGRQLVDLTPTDPPDGVSRITRLHNADVVDVDNDGIAEIFVVGQYPPPIDGSPGRPDSIFKLSGGRYVESEHVVGLWEFEAATGAPEPQRLPFSLPAGAAAPYTLQIVNGRAGNTSRVTAAQIRLNDRVVVGSKDVDDRIAALERRVRLASENELVVRVAGAPGSRILVIVRSRNWQP